MKEKKFVLSLDSLGIKEKEVFNIVYKNGYSRQFYFVKDNLYTKNHELASLTIALELITGEATIEKLSWDKEETVYYIDANSEEIFYKKLEISTHDLAMLKCEWYFRTREEAKRNKEYIINEIRKEKRKLGIE